MTPPVVKRRLQLNVGSEMISGLSGERSMSLPNLSSAVNEPGKYTLYQTNVL